MRNILQDFNDFKVWQKSHQLTLQIYQHTRNFAKEELYGITSQIRRASSSIPTNIAEGCGREGGRDFARFLQIAMGSGTEVVYLILLCKDIQLLSPQIYEDLQIETTQIKKMLASFIKKLRSEN